MAKQIYVYINDDDLRNIAQIIVNSSIVFVDALQKKASAVTSVSEALSFDLLLDGIIVGIKYFPCSDQLSLLQPGLFLLEDNPSKEGLFLFARLKEYIQRNLLLSKDKSFYFGPGFLSDWKAKKYALPVLLDYNEFTVPDTDLGKVLQLSKLHGLKVRQNMVRLRNIDILEETADSFIIYAEDAEILYRLINRSRIQYLYGSDCVFVERNQKKKTINFQIDVRLLDNPDSKTSRIFTMLFRNLCGDHKS